MTHQHFAIGEIAPHVRWGINVMVTSPLIMVRGVRQDTGEVRIGLAYGVVRGDSETGRWSAPPSELRKIVPRTVPA